MLSRFPKGLLRFSSLVFVSILFVGCGGTKGGGTGGGSSQSMTLSYDLKGVCGILVGNVQASSAPQQIQLQVNGSTRSISNVLVGVNTADGTVVTVLSQGSAVLNASIANASQGAVIGGTNIHVPISAGGVLQASVLGAASTPDQAVVTTPAAVWQGVSLPNGINVLLQSSNSGDLEVSVNANVHTNGANVATGNAAVRVSAPSVSQAQVRFSGSNDSLTLDGTQTVGGTTNYTATWQSYGSPSSYTLASVGGAF